MATDTQNHSFPPAIAKAVITVMKELGTLSKERENKFDHYEYASIDDFIDHVRGPCAKAGLFIIPDESRDAETQEVTKKDGKPMVVWSSRFGFTLVHESGECYGPIHKSVCVQFNGAQAAGAAQSYAMKQFMRGLFQIKTGDKDDPDKEKVEISSKGENQTDLQTKATQLRGKLRGAKDMDALGLAWSDGALDLDFIKRASPVAYEHLEKEYATKARELENA